MKVLNILSSGMFMDGITNSVLNYYRNLDLKKIHVDFASTDIIEEFKEELNRNGSAFFKVANKRKRPITFIKQLVSIIKENKFDVVHAHGSSSLLCLEMIAAKIAGCKIRIAHSRNTITNHKALDKLLRPLFYCTYTHAFACGEDAGKWLFGNRNFEVIRNGKDIEKFEYKEEIRKKIRNENNLENKIAIGIVGRMNYQKNHEYLIDVFNELNTSNPNKYILVIIGNGNLYDKIKEKIHVLNLEKDVLMLGEISNVNEWLQALDIMILTSRYEGFPNVLVEWQIAGLPCVISDKITKDVELTNLVHFESIEDSPKKWAETIENIDIEDRDKTKQEILNQIKEKGFDIKENAKRLENIYMQILEEVGNKRND